MSKYQRTYIQCVLPDGDKITLSFKKNKTLDEFLKQHPDYELVYKSDKHPLHQLHEREEILECAKNTQFTYSKMVKDIAKGVGV